MALLEDHTVSFIVRVWREIGDGPVMSREWRGSVEHVQSGQRSFFRDLKAVADFMQPHLEQLGIGAPFRFWDVMTPELFEAPAAPVATQESAAPPARGRRPAVRRP